jgi:hypothetical protein
MPTYAPPPGSPPATSQYNLPPGPPAPTRETARYDPPPGSPPLQPGQAAKEPENPSEPPPPYSKSPAAGSVLAHPTLVTLSISPVTLGRERDGPLDPPPSCFSTPSPARIRSRSFESFRIPSVSSSISDGFQPLYAPNELGSHGIGEHDWAEFLAGIHLAAINAGSTKPLPKMSAVGGMVSGLTGRAFAGRQYDKAFVKSPLEEAKALVEVWQGSAFERRKLRVNLQPRVEESGKRREGYDLIVEAT